MKKAIIDAGLETEDLVERSHVEERYEEALALQPREADQSSSKAKGMAQAAALQKKASEPPKARPPAPSPGAVARSRVAETTRRTATGRGARVRGVTRVEPLEAPPRASRSTPRVPAELLSAEAAVRTPARIAACIAPPKSDAALSRIRCRKSSGQPRVA